ncbi:MAG: hypothetical protein EOP11_08720 [Proteobacteria bacterium]|nr:MAG: hypothetical protein EOP11_08720 [Pseudomonadota bacterium]
MTSCGPLTLPLGMGGFMQRGWNLINPRWHRHRGARLRNAFFFFAFSFALAPAAMADDCAFIRERLSRATAGETVSIPSGAFTCDEPIVLNRDGVSLRGATRDSTTLRLAAGANSPLIILGNLQNAPALVRDIGVSNLTLDGNMDQQPTECWGGDCGGNPLDNGRNDIRNNAITVRGAINAKIANVRAFNARSGGLVTERGTRGLRVANFEAHDNFFDGLAGYDTEGSLFSGIYLHHNHYAGISVDRNFSRNQFEDVLIVKNGDVGIFARWGEENSFSRLVVQANGSHGIYLAHDGGASSCATSYQFELADVLGNGGYGLWFNDPVCTGTNFVNSRFFENTSGCHHVAEGGSVTFSNTACR